MWSLLDSLVTEFRSAYAWLDLLAVLVVVGLAYGLARWIEKRFLSPKSDTPFVGQSEVSGVLFPATSWFLLVLLKHLFYAEHELPIQHVMTELFGCLALLRVILIAQVLVFKRSSFTPRGQRILTALLWVVSIFWAFGVIPFIQAALDRVTFKMGRTTLNLGAVLEDLFSSMVVMTFALGFARFLEYQVINRYVKDLSIRRICVNLSSTACLGTGVIACLSIFGVDISTLAVLGGGLGVGVGLGMQKLAANYVSGFVILLEGSVHIGDTVKVDGVEGRVADIKTRYTLINLVNGKEYLVPNESLISQKVENLTKFDQNYPLTTSVVVPQGVDVASLCELLKQAALSQERVLHAPDPVTYLSGFQAGGLQMTLNFWIADPANGKDNVVSAVNFEILSRLRAAGIVLPEPQYKVVLAGGVPPGRSTAASAKTSGTNALKTPVKTTPASDPNTTLF